METKPGETDAPGADREDEGQGVLEEKLRMLHGVLSLLRQLRPPPKENGQRRSTKEY